MLTKCDQTCPEPTRVAAARLTDRLLLHSIGLMLLPACEHIYFSQPVNTSTAVGRDYCAELHSLFFSALDICDKTVSVIENLLPPPLPRRTRQGGKESGGPQPLPSLIHHSCMIERPLQAWRTASFIPGSFKNQEAGSSHS